ncbi:MAG: sigma 54-interacting transcriptional regulator, partial [Deltaproteobacteria bacterium]|nr:sigma 54-interacting transcriptional regulator [Kofleriaceae bacterium]
MEDLASWRRRCAAEILGESKPIVRALDIIRRVARCRSSVLFVGETGTGKELFARALHRASPRASGPFVTVDCATVPEQVLEERLAAAAGGTLFLDEVGELSLAAQARLLRALEDGAAGPVDVRVVAATHRDLDALVAAGTYRADFYFRVSVVPVELPALRDRGADIELLAEAAIRHAVERGGQPVEL